jgi:hypothetical protein
MVVVYLVEFSEVLPLFYVSIPVIGLLVWYKIRSSQQIFKMKEKNKSAKKEQTVEGSIDKLIDNAPENLKQIESEIATLKSKGCTPDQLKRLEQEKQLLELATRYGDFAKPLIKPVSKILNSVIGGING